MEFSEPHVPGIEEFLPNWSRHRFVILDPLQRWATAIAAQTSEILERDHLHRGGFPVFESCATAREALLLSEARNTIGVVLFVARIEKECLGMLGRMARWARRPAVLTVCQEQSAELLPILMESGVDSVMFDVDNDIPIANWCVRLLNRD